MGDLMVATGGGFRLDIISLLIRAPRSPGDIRDRLKLLSSSVSKELGVLQSAGIVVFQQVPARKPGRQGVDRIYRLSDAVNLVQEGGMLQFGVQSAAGHWFWVHLDESFGKSPPVPVPRRFVR